MSLTRLGSLVTDRSSRGLFDGLFISSNSNESPSARRRFEDDVDLAESFGGRSTNLSELITTPRVRVAGDTPSSPDDADPISDTILLEKVKDGGSIGAEEFVIGALHRCDMIAISLCECLVLRRKPFDELLSRFPELEATIKERALEWYLASCERDKAICRNLVKSPKLLKCMGAADVFGSSSIAEHRIHETALFIATNDTAATAAPSSNTRWMGREAALCARLVASVVPATPLPAVRRPIPSVSLQPLCRAFRMVGGTPERQ